MREAIFYRSGERGGRRVSEPITIHTYLFEEEFARESSQVRAEKYPTGARKHSPVGAVSSSIYLKFIPRSRVAPTGHGRQNSRKKGLL